MAIRILVALVALVCLVACGDLESSVRRIELTGDANIPAGTTRAWTATAIRYDGERVDITELATWSVGAADIARVDRGALTGIATGTTNLTATYDGLTGSAAIAVVAPELATITLRSVSRLPLGVTQQLVVIGTFSDGSTGEVTTLATWASSDPTRVEIGDSGIVRAVALGTATITASIGELSTTMAIEVTDAAIATIEITPAIATLAKGLERQYGAIGHFTDGTSLAIGDQVTWESSAWAIATVSASGNVRGLRQGLATISARLGSGYGRIDLQVTQAVPVALAIAPHDGTLPRGFVQQLVAIATYSDGSRRDMTSAASWLSSSTDIAAVGGGRVEGRAPGAATITASVSGADGAILATTELAITGAALVALGLAVGDPRIPLAYGEDLVVTGTFDDGSTEDLTTQVTYATSAPHVVVTPAGRASAESAGSATVTATRDAISGTLELVAIDTAIVSLAVAPANAVVPLGQTLQLTATGTFSDGLQYPLTDDAIWATSSEQIARVVGGLVTPMSEGAATITALVRPSQPVFDQAAVTVAPP